MKRVVTAAINKRAALEALADYERTIYQAPMYSVGVDIGKNCVSIEGRDGEVVAIVYPDTQPIQVTGHKFRKATQEDIDQGKQLYVRESYTRNTQEQIPKELSVASIKSVN